MSTGSGAIAGAEAAQDAARDYAAVRANGDIQFAPYTPPPPDPPPQWLEALARFLRSLFEPVGQAIGVSWPVFEVILIVVGVTLAAFLIWRLGVQPLLDRRRAQGTVEDAEWVPQRGAALALLDEADRLAAAGDYGAATHLLLQRSVGHIAASRPEWLKPASTAREIATLEGLPASARTAFAAIATRVERSLFALRSLDAADWQAARSAYADFALARFA